MKAEDRLYGRFELHEITGQGAMDTVFRATDLMFDETLAVKRLHLNDERMVERFAAETDISVRLNRSATAKYVERGHTPEVGATTHGSGTCHGPQLRRCVRAKQSNRRGLGEVCQLANFIIETRAVPCKSMTLGYASLVYRSVN